MSLTNELKEEATEKIENIISIRDSALSNFLNILFWKDSSAGYLTLDDS